MTRDEILSQHPIATFIEQRGIRLRGRTPKLLCTTCPLGEHKTTHLCVEINVETQLWYCHDHGVGGTVVDWLMHEFAIPADEVFRRLDPSRNGNGAVARSTPRIESRQPPPPPPQSTGSTAEATYSYTDENGNEIYQVVRYPGKDFKQRHKDKNGKWVWNMQGITRVLFQLPKVLLAQEVAIAEGEKDCLNLGRCGLVGTCNVGGAGKWFTAYDECLLNKDLLIFPDNDEPGYNHVEKIIASLRDKVNSIKKIQVPPIFKDVSDYLESFASYDEAQLALSDLIRSTPHLLKPPPIFDMKEMESQYTSYLNHSIEHQYDLGKFLPSFGKLVNEPLESGEVVLVIGDTGIGKSALLQAFARAATPLPTLFFEMELPITLVFQRFVQMERKCFSYDVMNDYRNSNLQIWDKYHGLKHILVCPESGISTTSMESYIIKSALKFGRPCAVVCVDYVGLIRGPGKSRYEAISNSAEQLKVIAKRTNTIVFVASQIGRPDDKRESQKIRLHDARDSGALENSAGLVLGVTRSAQDKMTIQVLKNTKGVSGYEIIVKFDGARMQITDLD